MTAPQPTDEQPFTFADALDEQRQQKILLDYMNMPSRRVPPLDEHPLAMPCFELPGEARGLFVPGTAQPPRLDSADATD